MEGSFTFDVYRRVGNKHTEVVIDDSEVFALILVFSTVMDGMPSKAVKDACREGHRSVRRLMRGGAPE